MSKPYDDEVERCEFCGAYVDEDDCIECTKCGNLFWCCVDCSFLDGEEELCPVCFEQDEPST